MGKNYIKLGDTMGPINTRASFEAQNKFEKLDYIYAKMNIFQLLKDYEAIFFAKYGALDIVLHYFSDQKLGNNIPLMAAINFGLSQRRDELRDKLKARDITQQRGLDVDQISHDFNLINEVLTGSDNISGILNTSDDIHSDVHEVLYHLD